MPPISVYLWNGNPCTKVGTNLFSLQKLLSFTRWNKKVMDSMIEYGYIYFLEIRTTLITVFVNDFLDWKTTHTHPMKLKHLPSYFSKQKKIEFPL